MDLAGLRRGSDDPPVSDELMAYSLYGAGEEIFMRASWDDAYSPREILRAHLFLYLAVDAAYTGRCDTVERLRSYEPADRPSGRARAADPAAAGRVGQGRPRHAGSCARRSRPGTFHPLYFCASTRASRLAGSSTAGAGLLASPSV